MVNLVVHKVIEVLVSKRRKSSSDEVLEPSQGGHVPGITSWPQTA